MTRRIVDDIISPKLKFYDTVCTLSEKFKLFGELYHGFFYPQAVIPLAGMGALRVRSAKAENTVLLRKRIGTDKGIRKRKQSVLI